MEELDETRYSAYALVPSGVKLSDLLTVKSGFVSLRSDSTRDRKYRSSAVTALKLAIERHYGVRLEKAGVSYSETHGFLSRTEVRYRVEKG